MSHNSFKVGTAEPTALGVITPRVEQLANVAVSGVATNDILQYDADTDTWSNTPTVPPSASNTSPIILIGRGESNDYANSGYTTAVGQRVGFYDTAPINTITGATLNVTTGTSWVHSVTLPAGKYVLTAQVYPVFSTSGLWALRWLAGASVYSSLAAVGTALGTYGGASSTLIGQAELTSTTTLWVQVVGSSGLSATQGTAIAENGVLYIRKIS